MRNNRLCQLVCTGAVLVLSAAFSVPALADGGSLPSGGAASGRRTSTAGGPSSSLSQLPSGTRVVVVDTSGNKLALGSQAAADILASGDPIWCPSSVASPAPLVGGCSGSYGSLYALTNDVETGVFKPVLANSTIWINAGADLSGSPAVLDGAIDSHDFGLRLFTLTLNGGWTGGSSIDPTNPSSIPVGISITWNGTVGLNNISDHNSASHGISIVSNKNINLNGVSASNSWTSGAYLDASGGTGVSVVNSTFNGNDQSGAAFDGLEVFSKGSISLTDVTAGGNVGSGAYLNTGSYGTAGVTLGGTNVFDHNGQDGLEVYSGGSISSASLDANENGAFGAYLHNSGAGALPVTLTGTSSFSLNGTYGLSVVSKGSIAVNNLTADLNSNEYGVHLTNNFSPSAPSPVTVSGTNSFDQNADYGLGVNSDGSISLNNINADGNGIAFGYDGLYADNSGASQPQSLTLKGTNTFSNNGSSGAALFASGSVTVNNVTAGCNGYLGDCATPQGGQGLLIVNDWLGSSKPQGVTLAGTNTLNANDQDNLAVQTYGAVSISSLTANNSLEGMGADLYYYDHGTCCDATGAVNLTGTNTFQNNHSNGLYVLSSNQITASNLYASSNGSSSSDAGIYLSSVGGIAISGANTFSFNRGFGLQAVSAGSITASNLTAEANGILSAADAGVAIISAKNVVLTGVNTFDFNYGYGLQASGGGTFSSSNLTANNNSSLSSSDAGVQITSAGKVSLGGVNTFNFDYGVGLEIASAAAISASDLNATGNSLTSANDGVRLSSAGGISLTGLNIFDHYSGYGLYAASSGSITASNLNAGFNGYGGLDQDGAYLANSGSVTLSGTNSFQSNYGDGLQILSGGSVTASNLTAKSNGSGAASNGVWIDNRTGTSKTVVLSGTNTFNSNNGNGLVVYSHGAITASNITANYNYASGDGAYLDNCDYSAGCQGSGNVTLTGTNTFLSNATGFDEGLEIHTNGNVSATHVTANYNDNDGMAVYDTGGTVTVTCGSFFGNGWDSGTGYGLVEYTTHGTPAHTYLSGVDASGNSFDLASGIYNVTTTARSCPLP